MAEYIDREQLLELINEDCKYQNPTNEYTRGCNEVCDWAIKMIKNIPTADVVPKSEVEQLKAMYEDNETQRAYTINMLGEHLETAKNEVEREYGNALQTAFNDGKLEGGKEVAREIFEEIEKAWRDSEYCAEFDDALAELKKKYTEVQHDG